MTVDCSRKLSFINKAATPFAGKNLLDQLAKSLEVSGSTTSSKGAPSSILAPSSKARSP